VGLPVKLSETPGSIREAMRRCWDSIPMSPATYLQMNQAEIVRAYVKAGVIRKQKKSAHDPWREGQIYAMLEIDIPATGLRLAASGARLQWHAGPRRRTCRRRSGNA